MDVFAELNKQKEELNMILAEDMLNLKQDDIEALQTIQFKYNKAVMNLQILRQKIETERLEAEYAAIVVQDTE